MAVERYSLGRRSRCDGRPATMEQDPEGIWVAYSDYERLEKKLKDKGAGTPSARISAVADFAESRGHDRYLSSPPESFLFKYIEGLETDKKENEARRERDETRDDISTVLQAFDDEVFIRNIDADSDPSWAMKLVRPIGALARLQQYAARSEENSDD